MRTILLIVSLLATVVAGFGSFMVYRASTTAETSRAYGDPFTLVDQDGNQVTEAQLRGHPSALFFGFTQCPEVCPTTLYEMDQWLETLGDEGADIRPYFVSIDPERDTPEVLKTYISNVSDRIVGWTGKPDDVAAMAKSFGIYVKKVPLEDGDYTMDHTASVILLKPSGDFFGTIGYGEDPKAAIAKLKRLAGA